MCVIACVHFWQQSLWHYKPPVVDVSKLPVSYVFVRYLKPEYFDDHFDLCNDNYRRRLLGKCLSVLANHLHAIGRLEETDELRYYGNNLAAVGLALHEKLDRLMEHMERWVEEGNVRLNASVVRVSLGFTGQCHDGVRI